VVDGDRALSNQIVYLLLGLFIGGWGLEKVVKCEGQEARCLNRSTVSEWWTTVFTTVRMIFASVTFLKTATLQERSGGRHDTH
jgi:hypothetical protein